MIEVTVEAGAVTVCVVAAAEMQAHAEKYASTLGQSDASGNDAEDDDSVEEGSVDDDAVDCPGAHRRPSLPLFLSGAEVTTANVTVVVTVLTTVVV
jgi:hypothetical protein